MIATLTSLLFAAVAIGFTVLAAVMNWRFGQSLGRSDFDQIVFAAVGLGVDVTKMLLPFVITWAIKNRRLVVALVGSVVLIGVVSYSVAGLAGYFDMARAQLTGAVSIKKGTAEDVRAELARKQTQLAGLRTAEPASVIEARLVQLRQNVHWQGSEECTAPRVREARTFCSRYAEVLAELAIARSAEQLMQEITELRRRHGEVAAVESVTGGDPRVDVLTRLWGWEQIVTQTWLGLLSVAIIELMSTFGLLLAFRHGELSRIQAGGRSRSARRRGASARAKSAAASMSTIEQQIIDPPRRVAANFDNRPIGDIAKFVVTVMQPEEGSSVAFDALYPLYVSWCTSRDVRPYTPELFGEALEAVCEAVGLRRRIDDGKVMCVDVKLAA